MFILSDNGGLIYDVPKYSATDFHFENVAGIYTDSKLLPSPVS